jgi:hypothetical protein
MNFDKDEENFLDGEYRRHKAEAVRMKHGIPLLNGRPERERVIGEDDIMNLRIALGTATSLDAFIAMV